MTSERRRSRKNALNPPDSGLKDRDFEAEAARLHAGDLERLYAEADAWKLAPVGKVQVRSYADIMNDIAFLSEPGAVAVTASRLRREAERASKARKDHAQG